MHAFLNICCILYINLKPDFVMLLTDVSKRCKILYSYNGTVSHDNEICLKRNSEIVILIVNTFCIQINVFKQKKIH